MYSFVWNDPSYILTYVTIFVNMYFYVVPVGVILVFHSSVPFHHHFIPLILDSLLRYKVSKTIREGTNSGLDYSNGILDWITKLTYVSFWPSCLILN